MEVCYQSVESHSGAGFREMEFTDFDGRLQFNWQSDEKKQHESQSHYRDDHDDIDDDNDACLRTASSAFNVGETTEPDGGLLHIYEGRSPQLTSQD